MIALVTSRPKGALARAEFQDAVVSYGAAVAGLARAERAPLGMTLSMLVSQRLAVVLSAYDQILAAWDRQGRGEPPDWRLESRMASWRALIDEHADDDSGDLAALVDRADALAEALEDAMALLRVCALLQGEEGEDR